tara:strand:+ start:2203 stop:2595 length:393 start_codon:yes stop_codon:yes gene_type:complete
MGDQLEFECSFKELSEWFVLDNNDGKKKKCGHYSSSALPVKGYGKKVWSVVAYIDVDYESHREAGYDDEQIVQGCVNFLNKPLTRRHRKPRYGKLTPNWFNVLEDKKVISVCLLIDQRNNKNFWGKGRKL